MSDVIAITVGPTPAPIGVATSPAPAPVTAQVVGTAGPAGPQGPVGPAGPGVYVQPTDPGMTTPGMWVQTGLGPDGSGITIWIEDGH